MKSKNAPMRMKGIREIGLRIHREFSVPLIFVFLLHVVWSSGAAAQSYTLTDLGTFGGTFSAAYNISNDGYVTGQSNVKFDTATHPFLYRHGAITDLGTLGGSNGIAFISNEIGQVVGPAEANQTDPYGGANCGFGTQFVCRAFLWQKGTMSDLGTLGGNNSWGNWINNQGQVVGWAENQALNPNTSLLSMRPFVLSKGVMSDLGTLGGYNGSADGINDMGAISGTSDVSKQVDPTLGYVPFHATLWANGIITDLKTLGGGFSLGFVINSYGQVIGGSALEGDQHMHATLWQNGAIKDLGTIAGDTDSLAFGIDDLGQVVGGSMSSTTGIVRAFLWQSGIMTDLQTLCPQCTATGYQLQIAFWINARGEIAACAVNAAGETHAVLLMPNNNSFRGKAGGAKFSASLRNLLLKKTGLGRVKSITWVNHQ